MNSRVMPVLDDRAAEASAFDQLLDQGVRDMLDRAVDQDEIVGRGLAVALGERPLDRFDAIAASDRGQRSRRLRAR